MPLNKDKYYTLQVHLNSHYDAAGKLIGTPIEFLDLTFDQVNQTRKIIWQHGVFIELTPISFQLIDPLDIKLVYFLEQPGKFNAME